MSLSLKTLRGILSPSGGSPVNPPGHCPLVFQNRVLMDVVGPEGLKQRVEHTGNRMVTYGLNRLVEMLASDAGGASDWVSCMAVGTHTSAEGSSQDTLGASTGEIAHLSEASMVASDAGALTLQYNATFDDGSAYEIHEIGLFCTNSAAGSMAARAMVTGANSVNKGAADSVYVSYQVIASTA